MAFLLFVIVSMYIARVEKTVYPCTVEQPTSASTLISAIRSRNVELALSAWDESYKPTAMETVKTLIPPNTVSIDGIDWFGSCKDSLGDTKTLYVIHITSTENYSKQDIVFIVTTSTRGMVKEVNYV